MYIAGNASQENPMLNYIAEFFLNVMTPKHAKCKYCETAKDKHLFM